MLEYLFKYLKCHRHGILDVGHYAPSFSREAHFEALVMDSFSVLTEFDLRAL